MRTTQQFSITLPYGMAEVVESKVKSGAYASRERSRARRRRTPLGRVRQLVTGARIVTKQSIFDFRCTSTSHTQFLVNSVQVAHPAPSDQNRFDLRESHLLQPQ
jgi:hypothetical protein